MANNHSTSPYNVPFAFSSPDGEVWNVIGTNPSANAPTTAYCVRWLFGKWYITGIINSSSGSTGVFATTSNTDGTGLVLGTWNILMVPTSIAGASSTVLVAGSQSNPQYLCNSAPPGPWWTTSPSLIKNTFYAIEQSGNNNFVAVGKGLQGPIIYSQNTTQWNTGSNSYCIGITASACRGKGSTWVAGGPSGLIARSINGGQNWTAVQLTSENRLGSINGIGVS